MGEEALKWLSRVKKELGLKVGTEVANAQHVQLALKYDVDVLWIGARTTASPFTMQELAEALRDTDKVVLVKNPMNPDLDLWMGAIERLNACGIKKLGAIHRGFTSYEKKLYRNVPMWQIPIELHRRMPNLPIINDPSHISGRRDLIAPLCQQAMDLGMDGLMVESHCDPDKAWSDASQQVTPDVLDYILSMLTIRETVDLTASLSTLRKGIDEIDNELIDLLAKRMGISREIGAYKRDNGMTIVQTKRYSEILDKRAAQGVLKGIDAECIKKIFECIHEESVRQQVELLR
jgi:chorismate mutase